jgi:hypothetical protein
MTEGVNQMGDEINQFGSREEDIESLALFGCLRLP